MTSAVVGLKANRAECALSCATRLYTTLWARPQAIPGEMTYVFAMTRIQAGGVETLHHVAFAVPGLRLLSLVCVSSSSSSKDAKAAFVTAIDTLHDLHAFAKEQVLGRRSRIPVSCAGCLVIILSLFARVDDATSEKWSLDSTSLHFFFEHKYLVWPCLAAWVCSPQTYKPGLLCFTR